MRLPRRFAIVAATLALGAGTLLLAAPRAFAVDIPRLQGPVTDQAGVLGSDKSAVEAALADLLRRDDVQLFILFVGTTGEMTATDFADETARVNSLGSNDALLMVAIGDRTDAIWVSNGLPGITDPELNTIIADDLEPALRDGNFAGAAIATAAALGEANAAPAVPTPGPTVPGATSSPEPPPSAGGSSGGGIDFGLILGLLLVVGGLVVVGGWLSARLAARREAEERDRETGRLAREANSLLVGMDERTRSADQEAGFVEAEFGEAEAAPFRAAIAAAREDLKAAFGIRQKLDDAEPEDPPTRAAMLKEIVERCTRAGAALDGQAARIQELRDLERNAASILGALPGQVAAQEARLPTGEAALASLAGYAESTWSAVKGNVAEARKGLSGAKAAIERGNAAVARNDGRAAAREIRTAQEGIAGATTLLDGVDKLAAAVRDADTRLPDELRAAETDLAAARDAVSALPTGGADAHAAAAAAAQDALGAAKTAATAAPRDPQAAYKLAAAARRGAGDLLGAIRQDAAQRAQFAAALQASLASAKADVDRAADFIATRRGGVGRRARTRLAEAESSLENAMSLRETDQAAAMDQARRAERLAEEAYSLAAQDFEGWDQGGPNPSRGGGDLGTAILGGIIGGILSGGGRGGGGWGGSPWGSSGPFGGGGGWGGGHSQGGGFGGFGGGGGGGHSQGGRW